MKTPRYVRLNVCLANLQAVNLEDETEFHQQLMEAMRVLNLSDATMAKKLWQMEGTVAGWRMGTITPFALIRITILHYLEDELWAAIDKAEWWENLLAETKGWGKSAGVVLLALLAFAAAGMIIHLTLLLSHGVFYVAGAFILLLTFFVKKDYFDAARK